MKDRLLTFALAIAAFALFYALVMPKPPPPQERTTRPVTTETGPNGYLGLMRWLELEGLNPISFRERYTRLAAAEGPPTGNLLLSTAPHLYPVRDSEVGPLRDWIAAGNTLFIVAGLSDTPEWSMGEGMDPDFMSHMFSMTRLSFEQVGEKAGDEDDAEGPSLAETVDALQRLAEPQKFEMVPTGVHPLLAGVRSVTSISEYPTAQWRAIANTSGILLELAQDPVSGVPMLWMLRHGNGQIIFSAYGSVFTNKSIGAADNARLLANVVNHSLGTGGRVLIDDAHQGLVAFYDPEAFFGDLRLHVSLLWLLALWLVFVLGPQRLRLSPGRWSPLDITSFVRASGGFMARVLRPSAAGQQLFANFFNDIRRQIGLPQDGAPLWDWIAQRPAVTAGDLEQLRRLHAQVMGGSRVDLTKLQNLLVQIRNRLQ